MKVIFLIVILLELGSYGYCQLGPCIKSFPAKTTIKGREVSCKTFTRENITCEDETKESFGCLDIRVSDIRKLNYDGDSYERSTDADNLCEDLLHAMNSEYESDDNDIYYNRDEFGRMIYTSNKEWDFIEDPGDWNAHIVFLRCYAKWLN